MRFRDQLRVSGVTSVTYWAMFLTIHITLVGVIAIIGLAILLGIGIPEFSTSGQSETEACVVSTCSKYIYITLLYISS